VLALGSDARKVNISAPDVQNLASLASKATTIKSLTLDSIRGPFGDELHTFLEEATGRSSSMLCRPPR